MGFTHWMEVDDHGEGAIAFSCPEPNCGRRVVVGGADGFQVIATGDFYARHVGAVGPVSLEVGSPG